MKLLKIIKNLRTYRLWKAYRRGEKPITYKKGAGYYLALGMLGAKNIGKIEKKEMKSGKVGIFELIDYKAFNDPDDMVEESFWHFIGYEGEKLLKEMSFDEFSKYFKSKK